MSIYRARVGERDVKVNIFDFGGLPCFLEVRNEFYNDAQGCLMVYDVTDPSSFKALDGWLSELKREFGETHDQTKLVVIVCANKTDKRRAVSETDGRLWAEQRGFRYFETSALNGNGVDEVFQILFDGVVSVLEGVPLQMPQADSPRKVPQYTKEQLDAIDRVKSARDNYERLGLKKGAGRDEINKAYRRLAVLLHPDKTGGAPGSEEAFKVIVTARADLLRTAYN